MARELSNELRYIALQMTLSIPLPQGAVWSAKELIETAEKIRKYLEGEGDAD